MKTHLFLGLCVALSSAGCAPPTDDDEPITDDGAVDTYVPAEEGEIAPPTSWELSLVPADLTALLNPDPELNSDERKTYYPCVLEVDGERYEPCEVRLRGGSSLYLPKLSFRIELDSNDATPGYSDQINLRAEYGDASYLRNLVAMEVFRRLTDLPVSRVRFVSLSFNGEPYGLMAEVERIGGPMLTSWGLDSDRSMYEVDPSTADRLVGGGSMIPLPDDLLESSYQGKLGAPDDMADLKSLFSDVIWADFEDSPALADDERDVVTVSTRIREAIDVDRYLDFLAVMAAIHSHDHVKKNTYFTWQTDAAGDDRWLFLPWDLDLTFGCVYDGDVVCDSYVVDEWYDTGRLFPGMKADYPTEDFFNMLVHLVVFDPELRPILKQKVCDVMHSDFWRTGIPTLTEDWAAVIEDAVVADTHDRNANVEEFHAAVAQVSGFPEDRLAFLGEWVGCAP